MHRGQAKGRVAICEQEKAMIFKAHRWLIDWHAWKGSPESHHEQSLRVDAVVSSLPARLKAVLIEEYSAKVSRRPTQAQRALYLHLHRYEYAMLLETARLVLADRMRVYSEVLELKRNLPKVVARDQNVVQQMGG